MIIQINSVYPLIYKVYFLENVYTSAISGTNTLCPLSQYKENKAHKEL